MDHKYAMENHVAEGYLLDDLDERERDAYEDHFFGCSTCADEVETVSIFIDTARQAIREETQAELAGASAPVPVASWFQRIMPPMMRFMPATACALFLATFGFAVYQHHIITQQNVQQNYLSMVRVDTEVTLTDAHAATEVIKTPRFSRLSLKFSIPPSGPENFSSYDVQIVTNSGTKKKSISIPKAQANDPQTVILSTDDLKSGKYFLVIRGVNSNGTESKIKEGELKRHPFELELQ